VNIVILLLFGALCGGIAKQILPGRCPDGWLPTIALGVVGSVAGGLPFGGHMAGLIGSVIGAVACLYLYSIWSVDR